MLLILEVILTIFAWRKGWKWLALLPVGIVLILGLLIGFSIGISGGDVAPTTGIFRYKCYYCTYYYDNKT